MKNLILLIFIGIHIVSAEPIRVNNSAGSNAPYKDLITAHAVAQAGDTIMIEGSNTSYGNLTVTKPLVFIGPGYFLLENPNTPASLPAIVGTFNLDQTGNDDPNSGAAGTKILGLNFTASFSSNIRVDVNNVLVAKCLINQDVFVAEFDVTGTQVIQNYFYGKGLAGSFSNPGLNNIIFANNIVEGNFALPDNSSGVIFHNLFLGDRFGVISFNGEIRGNIATSVNTTNFIVSTTGQGNYLAQYRSKRAIWHYRQQ